MVVRGCMTVSCNANADGAAAATATGAEAGTASATAGAQTLQLFFAVFARCFKRLNKNAFDSKVIPKSMIAPSAKADLSFITPPVEGQGVVFHINATQVACRTDPQAPSI